MSDHDNDQPWGGDLDHHGDHHGEQQQHGEQRHDGGGEHAHDGHEPNHWQAPPPPAWDTDEPAGHESNSDAAADVDQLPTTLPIGRPPLDRDGTTITWRVKAPDRLDAALKELIKREGGDRSKHVRKAVAAYLDAHR